MENVIQKKTALDRLKNKVSDNGQSQIEAISVAKSRSQFVNTIDERSIDVSLIDPNPYQPRKKIDPNKITELADSIKENGLIAPIAVRKINESSYQIIAGDRRLRAVKQIGLQSIQAIIFDADDEAMAVMALSENIDREDLSDYETGQAIFQIEHLFRKKTELAKYTGKVRSDIYRYLSFNNLPDWIKNRLNNNPNLINRNNAQQLVSLHSEENFERKYKDCVISALNEIEAGSLTQTMLIPKIKKLMREIDNPRRLSSRAIKKIYLLNGKNIGKFDFDDNKMSIKINSDIIDEHAANEIYQLIADKLNQLS